MSEKRNRSGVCPLGDSLFNNSLQELEGELVADSELDYAVLVAIVTVLVYFGHTQIVTKVENCLFILKRKAEGNGVAPTPSTLALALSRKPGWIPALDSPTKKRGLLASFL